ncbi:hypothetical protein [Ramlibacter albus]|uniref:Uncharacterized protein n=1 Tax=Ramlibacter albus TaxID=2079448 RepID=A0A923M8U9_9BURK|nr:hypothetical protein [Ramlibacter albus]MBC5766140.1 hypothetical protein [Ramlibacter albus]
MADTDFFALSRPDSLTYLGVYRAVYGTRPTTGTYSGATSLLDGTGMGGVSGLIAGGVAAIDGATLARTVLANIGVSAGTLGGSTPSVSYSLLETALGVFFSAFPNDRAQVIVNVARILPNLEGDGVFGNAARAFNATLASDIGVVGVPDYVPTTPYY